MNPQQCWKAKLESAYSFILKYSEIIVCFLTCFSLFLDAAPIMTYRFIDQTMQPGPLVSLKCATRGSPTPKITWTLNGRDLPKTGGTGG